jgi:NAD(P)-dependent dehydrogenase (short-subunit alcohol dehydrogenase family)
MGRLITPKEIASAIIFLASPVQAAITGTALNVDGGLHSLRIPKK